jgi:hypothetical protein
MRCTPTTQQSLYREGIQIKSLTRFFRLQDRRFQATGHKAQTIRVTGYLMLDDDHKGSAGVGATISISAATDFIIRGRSTAWEIQPIIKIEVLE